MYSLRRKVVIETYLNFARNYGDTTAEHIFNLEVDTYNGPSGHGPIDPVNTNPVPNAYRSTMDWTQWMKDNPQKADVLAKAVMDVFPPDCP